MLLTRIAIHKAAHRIASQIRTLEKEGTDSKITT